VVQLQKLLDGAQIFGFMVLSGLGFGCLFGGIYPKRVQNTLARREHF